MINTPKFSHDMEQQALSYTYHIFSFSVLQNLVSNTSSLSNNIIVDHCLDASFISNEEEVAAGKTLYTALAIHNSMVLKSFPANGEFISAYNAVNNEVRNTVKKNPWIQFIAEHSISRKPLRAGVEDLISDHELVTQVGLSASREAWQKFYNQSVTQIFDSAPKDDIRLWLSAQLQ